MDDNEGRKVNEGNVKLTSSIERVKTCSCLGAVDVFLSEEKHRPRRIAKDGKQLSLSARAALPMITARHIFNNSSNAKVATQGRVGRSLR